MDAIARRQDPKAFESLFARHRSAAFGLAVTITGAWDLGEDALQESMLSLWCRARTYQPREGVSVRSWLLRVVANHSLSVVKKARHERSAKNTETKLGDLPSPAPESGEALSRQETLVRLRTALLHLPELDRQLVALAYGANMSHREIAKELGIPNSTISARLQRLLNDLRTGLKEASAATILSPALPQLCAEALLLGFEPPEGMWERVLNRIAKALADGRKSEAVPGALAASGAATFQSAAVVCATVLILSAAVLVGTRVLRTGVSTDSTTATELRPTPAAQATPPAAERMSDPAAPQPDQKPFEPQTWDFKTQGTFSTTFISDGKGTLFRGRSKSRGAHALCIDDLGVFGIMLPVSVPAHPTLVTAKYYFYRAKQRTDEEEFPAFLSVAWAKGGIESEGEWRAMNLKTTLFSYRQSFAQRFLVFEDRIVELDSRSQVQTVRKYRDSYPGNQLMVFAKNVAIESLSISALPSREIPETARVPEAHLPKGILERGSWNDKFRLYQHASWTF